LLAERGVFALQFVQSHSKYECTVC